MTLAQSYCRKADAALSAARLLLEAKDGDGACNRAYYAMFDAAHAILFALGVEGLAAPSRPITAFSRNSVKRSFSKAIFRRHLVKTSTPFRGSDKLRITAAILSQKPKPYGRLNVPRRLSRRSKQELRSNDTRASFHVERMKQAAVLRRAAFSNCFQALRLRTAKRLRVHGHLSRRKWRRTTERLHAGTRILIFKMIGRVQVRSRLARMSHRIWVHRGPESAKVVLREGLS